MIEEHVEEMINDLKEVTPHIVDRKESYRLRPKDFSSRVARIIVHVTAGFTDFLFKGRYNHRAVVIETIASVPGIIGGMFQHLKSLRYIQDDRGWIKTLLDEAENERIHLLVYSELAQPTKFERFLIIVVQFLFAIFYFFVYLFSPRTAHRVVGFFEEEAITSYEHFLQGTKEGLYENVKAPALAISYWNLSLEARLTDVIEATIKDEMTHRDVNHQFADDQKGTNLWK